MNSLKINIDNELKDYKIESDFNEVVVLYKKRKKKRGIIISSLSVFAILVIISGSAGFIMNNSNMGLTVSALTLTNTDEQIGKTPKRSECGVRIKEKNTAYDKNGIETASSEKAKSYFKRKIVSPSPLELRLSGEGLKSYKVTCGVNGSLYNTKGEEIKLKSISAKDKVFNWIPNCDKLTNSLSADISKIPSTLNNDKLITKELTALLKKEEDYTYFFGDTITITADYKGKASEIVKVEITLDETGSYYISKEG